MTGGQPQKQAGGADPAPMPTMFSDMKIVRDAQGLRYLAIPLTVVRIDSITGFDLYLRSQNNRQFILYRRGDLAFREEHLIRLADSQVREIYIPESQFGAYAEYIERHLDEIVSDPDIAVEAKSRIVYECSARLAKRALEQPWSGNNVAQARHVVGHTVNHIFQGKTHLQSMISMLSEDFTTYAHSVNVCVLGVGLAHRLGFSRAVLEDLGSGLLLHDVGKATIHPKILHKSTALSPEEWTIIQAHPAHGVTYLEQAGVTSPDVLAVVHQHHERCNGNGYPQGLTAEDIHIFAKIAALADVFDGLTTARADRPAYDSFQAIRIMTREMPGAFNTELLRVLVLMLKGKYRAPLHPAQKPHRTSGRGPLRGAA